MGTLNSTKYPNNSRIVVGSVDVFDNDSILLCNTSLGAVTINLATIPDNYWNTTYKLYIKDNSSNASVNNITIVAGSGQTINGASTLVISTNGASTIVRISSNNTYGADAPDGYTTIQEEGVSLPQRQILDFQGANVTATDNGSKTIVTITAPIPPPAFDIIDITYSAFQSLIAAGTVQKGWFYRISYVINTDEGAIIQGTTTNTNSLQGSGIFLNADYQNVGDYSGVPGFVANLGLWSPIVQPVVVGNVVIYDNLHFKNLTGAWGSAPSGDTTNWFQLPKSTTSGYIREIDFIKYNLATNSIIYRADKRGNEVESNLDVDFYVFKWGDDKTYSNSVSNNSRINNRNGYGWVYENVVSNDSEINTNSQYTTNLPTIKRNNVTSGSLLSIGLVNSGLFDKNIICNEGAIAVFNVDVNSSISLNFINRGIIQCNNISTFIIGSAITENTFLSGGNFSLYGALNGAVIQQCVVLQQYIQFGNETGLYYVEKQLSKTDSTFSISLDMNDAAIFSANTLTIPALYINRGVVTLLNSTGKTISKIVAPNTINYTFIPNVGETVTFQHTLIALSTTNQLVCDAPASGNLLTGRTYGSDYIQYKVLGERNLRSNLVLLA